MKFSVACLFPVISMIVSFSSCSGYIFEEVGSDVKDKEELDSWSNAVYIPEPTKKVHRGGSLLHWSFYARREGPLYLQLWRPIDEKTLRFQLVGQEYYRVEKIGVNTVSASKSIAALPGDVVGFRFPENSIIPFTAGSCGGKTGGLYTRLATSEGKVYNFLRMDDGWRPCRSYALLARFGPDGAMEVGRQPIDREFLDDWSNAMLIPEPHRPLSEGTVLAWQIYARKTGEVYLQVWRPTGSNSEYELLAQEKYHITRTGLHSVLVDDFVDVKSGDVLGFYYPGKSIIPFDGRECLSERALYVRNPPSHVRKVGAKVKFNQKQTGWNPCRKYSLMAIMIPGKWTGYEAKDRKDYDGWSSSMYIPNPDLPISADGYLYGWHFYSTRTNPIAFQVFRPIFGTNKYRLIFMSREVISEGKGLQHIGVPRVKVQKGDVLGFYFRGNSVVPFTGTKCYKPGKYTLYVKMEKKIPAVGTEYIFTRKLNEWKACREYSFGALFGAADQSLGKRSLNKEEKVKNVQGDLLQKLISRLAA